MTTEPRTSREALIAEVLGDLGRLLDQTQALVPAIAESNEAMLDASARLTRQVTEQCEAFDAQMTQLSSKAKAHVISHIAQRGDEAARRSIQQHVRDMDDSAHRLFVRELAPAMQRLAHPLQRLQDIAQVAANPWHVWLTHAATAACASAVTWALMTVVWR